eukprot:1640527-Prymnesium_polylepis.1
MALAALPHPSEGGTPSEEAPAGGSSATTGGGGGTAYSRLGRGANPALVPGCTVRVLREGMSGQSGARRDSS